MSDSTNISDATTQLPDIPGSVYVASLPTVPLASLPAGDPIDRTCVLCYIPYDPSNDDPVVILPCNHHFDRSCLLEWLSEENSGRNSCPTCRRPLFQIGEDTDDEEGLPPLFDREDYELYDELRLQGAPLPQRDSLRSGLELSVHEENALFQELRGRYLVGRTPQEAVRVGSLYIHDENFGRDWRALVGADYYDRNNDSFILEAIGDTVGWTVWVGDFRYRLRNISGTFVAPREWTYAPEELEPFLGRS